MNLPIGRCEFHCALGIDVLEIFDAENAKNQVLNMICTETSFQLAEVESRIRTANICQVFKNHQEMMDLMRR